jgi:cytochrome c-type biogenesis protein CcmE
VSLRIKLTLGLAVLVAVTTYVAYLGASSSWQYYLTVDECAARGAEFAGRRVRVSGRVAPGTLTINADRRGATLVLQGATGRLRAVCAGMLPDNLAEDMDVVVEGQLDSPETLHGEKVLTRCASKYESE